MSEDRALGAVVCAVCVILAVTVIGAWIGWTMTTAAPTKRIEDAVSEA